MDITAPPPPPSVLIEGLPNELALCVLARLPRALQAQLRLVCRAWNAALHPGSGAISPLRRSLAISEAWPVLTSYDDQWFLVDPILRRFHPVPLIHSEMFPVGNDFFIVRASEGSMPHSDMYWLDALGMQWHHLPPPNAACIYRGFASAILDGYLYIAGGGAPLYITPEGPKQGAERWFIDDSNTSSWERLPDMHRKRIWAKGLVFQGCFCVVGGYSWDDESSPLYSGEMWDPRTKEWALVPQLWPSKVFGMDIDNGNGPEIVVVMGKLYALKRATLEIMHFQDATQVWISFGRVPIYDGELHEHSCKLLGVGCELWLVMYIWDGYVDTLVKLDVKVLTALPASVSQPLSWELSPLIFEAGSKFLGPVVHV